MPKSRAHRGIQAIRYLPHLHLAPAAALLPSFNALPYQSITTDVNWLLASRMVSDDISNTDEADRRMSLGRELWR